MKFHKWKIIISAAAVMAALPAQAGDIEILKEQVEKLTTMVKDLQKQVQQQNQFMSDNGIPTPAERSAQPDFTKTEEWQAMKQDVTEALSATNQKRPGMFNPSLSAAVDFVSYYSRNDGADFVPRDVELMVSSNVDQYAFAYVIANAATELGLEERTGTFRRTEGGTHIGLEEAAIQTTSLPYGLQLKGGQFFADFTRIGKVHPHDRPFTDGPRSIDSIIGGETQARGFEMNWLTPLEEYVRLTLGMVDGMGSEPPNTDNLTLPDGSEVSPYDTGGFRSFSDLSYYARLVTLIEVGERMNLGLGVDGLTEMDGRRHIASADFKLEWQPFADEFDRLMVSGEAIWTRQKGELPDGQFIATGNTFNADAPAESTGWYAYLQYRFGKYWEPGIRFDYTGPEGFELRDVDGDGNAFELSTIHDRFYTYSAYLTAYASENHRIRLEASYVDVQNDPNRGGGNTPGNKSDWQVFLQWTITIGEHKHAFMP